MLRWFWLLALVLLQGCAGSPLAEQFERSFDPEVAGVSSSPSPELPVVDIPSISSSPRPQLRLRTARPLMKAKCRPDSPIPCRTSR